MPSPWHNGAVGRRRTISHRRPATPTRRNFASLCTTEWWTPSLTPLELRKVQLSRLSSDRPQMPPGTPVFTNKGNSLNTVGAERARRPVPSEIQGILPWLLNPPTRAGTRQSSSKPLVSAAHQANPLNLPRRAHLRHRHAHCAVEYLWLSENPVRKCFTVVDSALQQIDQKPGCSNLAMP